MLGTFLGIGEQFFGQRAILVFVLASSSRPRERPNRDVAIFHAHEDLWRASDQADVVVEREVKQKRTRVHHAQGAIDIKRVGGGLHSEPLARDDLKNVAGLDVFLAVPHDRFVSLARHVRLGNESRGAIGGDVHGGEKWSRLSQ